MKRRRKRKREKAAKSSGGEPAAAAEDAEEEVLTAADELEPIQVSGAVGAGLLRWSDRTAKRSFQCCL